jgi:hypothetical protein
VGEGVEQLPEKRFFSTLAGLSFILGTLLACSIPNVSLLPTATPVSTPTPIPTPELRRFNLPYSYEESSLRITIIEVVPATQEHGILVPRGYRQWTVNFQYENLLNTDWEPPNKDRIGHCAGLASFKLKTNQGNIYKPRFVGGSPFCDSLKPKAVSTQKELYIFEIKEDEKPTELWGYDVTTQLGEQLLYVFLPGQ